MFPLLKKLVPLAARNPAPARPSASRRPRLGLEALEHRELMAASLAASVLQPAQAIIRSQSGDGAALPSSVQSVLDSKVVAFDVTTTGSLSFNLSTGAYSAKVELPAGVTLNTSALKALLSGQFAVPKVDPAKALA